MSEGVVLTEGIIVVIPSNLSGVTVKLSNPRESIVARGRLTDPYLIKSI